MKTIATLLLSLALTGCYQSINSWDIERASEKCSGLTNVIAIEALFTGLETVICRDGKSHWLGKSVLAS